MAEVWMLFPDKPTADSAIAKITASMGLGDPGDVTTSWAVAVVTADSKWAVPKPEDRFMAGVTGYVIGTPAWPTKP